MQSINRTIVRITPKQPVLDWINSIPPDGSPTPTLEQLSEDNLAFLIPEYDNLEDSMNYIREKYKMIFELELWGWITAEEELWPKNRNWKMFNEWFDFEINSLVFDLVDEEIEKENMY